MSLSIFQNHASHKFSGHEIKNQLHQLHSEGHLDERQYNTLKGGLEALSRGADQAVTGEQVRHWLHNVATQHGDHIDSDKIHNRIAPAIASLLEKE